MWALLFFAIYYLKGVRVDAKLDNFQAVFRRISPSQGLVWALPPPVRAGNANELRSSFLWDGAVVADNSSLPLLSELTLFEGWRLSPEKLAGLLEIIKEGGNDLLLRMDWPPEAGAVREVCDKETLRWRELGPLLVNFSVSSFQDIGAELSEISSGFSKAGLPLAAEIFLENGINDDSTELKKILRALLKLGVRPHYLIAAGWLPDSRQVPPKKAMELASSLRGWISGLAVPQLVWEKPDGSRRPLIPEFAGKSDGDGMELINFKGERHYYP